jgi:hypothetical protein
MNLITIRSESQGLMGWREKVAHPAPFKAVAPCSRFSYVCQQPHVTLWHICSHSIIPAAFDKTLHNHSNLVRHQPAITTSTGSELA